MNCCDDLIKTMISALRHALAENSFTENIAEQLEQQIRSDFGGQSVYIAKLDRDSRRESVLREFDGRNRAEVCRKHGIGKAQFYRYLKGG